MNPILRVGPWASGTVTNPTFINPVATPIYQDGKLPVNLAKTDWSNQSWAAIFEGDVDSTEGAVLASLSDPISDNFVDYARHLYAFFYQATSSFDITLDVTATETNGNLFGSMSLNVETLEGDTDSYFNDIGVGSYTQTLTCPASRFGYFAAYADVFVTAQQPPPSGSLQTEIS